MTRALNNLYVAQAAKEQSDKSLLIASVQGSQLPTGISTSIFSGCDIGNYPSIFGTASIRNTSASGYTLNSGYNLLFGSCSQTYGNFTVGDTISFAGYLRNGFIHGIKINKK
jgi:hypothetical protein